MTQQILDAWDTAENPQVKEYASEYWGKVEAQSWWCVLEKGVGRTPFDPQKHSEDQKRTAIDILITPLADMGLQFNINRNMLAESREWGQVVLPSIRALGIHPREINGKWAWVQLVPIPGKDGKPETYTDSAGIVKERKTIQFVKIFDTEEQCQSDFHASKGTTQYKADNGNGNGDNKEKQTALAFLKVYVQNACRGQTDLNVIRETLALNIAQQPLISKYFTVDSPETMELIAQYMVPF